ncbi:MULTISPECIES: hypothetical protein [unclassified Clostridium]|uniref:hypothetical protein n=1 Tax=unclassified Clostridium TaxID=2614128 RepID=UPI000297419E|nr:MULTISPECIES: hypothetical protein [unclassified Clostridium]EKQ56829.1 MAG: hypothetical protein A370_01604 [Clostridium sp. Maddingley MBC34-26]
MNKIPIKFRVAQVIYQNEGVSNLEILKILNNEYPFDRSINERNVEEYLLSLKAVGIIELTNAITDKNGKLKMFYKITDYGKSRMKYIEIKSS